MSGLSNVLHWLSENDITAVSGLAEHILDIAKQRNKVLSDKELINIVNGYSNH